MITGKKILITGATGAVGRPVAERLAEDNEVWCVARFSDPEVEQQFAGRGIRTRRWAMTADDLGGLPEDFTHVMHAARDARGQTTCAEALSVNASAAGRLMLHCRDAEAFLFLSSGVVYGQQTLDHLYCESDPLGGEEPWLPTYFTGKLAAEAAVHAFAATLRIPTTVARLNVAYGPYGHGGLPVLLYRQMLAGRAVVFRPEGQHRCSPIHIDDVVRQLPLMWGAAETPPTTVNWGGDDVVGVRDLMEFITELTGVPGLAAHEGPVRMTYAFDNVLRRTIAGDCEIPWREGVRQTLEAHFPGSVRAAA